MKPWQRALDLFTLGDVLFGGNVEQEGILKVLRTVYLSDFDSHSQQQVRSLIVELVMRAHELPFHLRRVVLDLSWSYTDDGYKVKLYDAR